jgi:hypothetical protein
VYHGSLTDRSVTVTATWEMAGMVPEIATMMILLLVVEVVDAATLRTAPSPGLPRVWRGREGS